MKKITFIIIVFALWNSVVQAQISIGVRTGFNLATWSYTPKNTTSNTNYTITEPLLLGFTFVMPIEVKLSNNFALQPELSFIQKGFTQKRESGSDYVQDTYIFNYLEVPLLAKIILGNKKFKVGVLAGPSFGYLVSGRDVTAYGASQKFYVYNKNIDFNDAINKTTNRFDIGLVLGVQPAYNITDYSRIFFDARYQLGLSDIKNDSPDNTQIFNRGIGLSVGAFTYFK